MDHHDVASGSSERRVIQLKIAKVTEPNLVTEALAGADAIQVAKVTLSVMDVAL